MFKNYNDNIGDGAVIKCEVNNCKHYDDKGYCKLQKICIGPGYAASVAETNCNSFEMLLK